MIDLLLAAAALVVLLVVTVVLLRSGRRSGLLVAVVVLAAGTFAVTLYRGLSSTPDDRAAPLPVAGGGSAPTRLPVVRVEVPMGTGDKLPQGALWLDPPRNGTDAYTGDLSVLCSTPGKTDHQQNCTGDDRREWTVEPLERRAVIGLATGDPFTDPAACGELRGGYLELTAGKAYCGRLNGQSGPAYAFRIPEFPTERPLPQRIVVEVAVLP